MIGPFLWPDTAQAVGNTTKYHVPLTTPYPACNDESDSTGYCDQAADIVLTSPWTFDQGAIVIDYDEVGLRLDNIRLRTGLTCTGVFGSDDYCMCWDDSSSNADCDTDDECGGNQGTNRIRRGSSCYVEVNFDVKASNSNKNRQVNQSVSRTLNCGYMSSSPGPEIRHVEVLDAHGNLVAVATH